jgi:erythromycin esterase-like protein
MVSRGGGDDGRESIRASLPTVSRRVETSADLDPLMERIGDAHYVLLGEASHGTSEYYTWRSRITERLVREKGFSFVAVEGDWPDCSRVNRYVKGDDGGGATAHEVLHGFARWPTWMWANREVVHLCEWLRGWNQERPEEDRVGFYGLDVYSLWESMDAVVRFLRERDPKLAREARGLYACFDPFGRDEQEYARATAGRYRMAPMSCEEEAIAVLRGLRERRARSLPTDDGDAEAEFDAEQNAICAVNAEEYYRAMVRGDEHSWNIRDTHMADTLERLVKFHRGQRDVVKAVVWEHNTHIGDARATDMAAEGMVNIGQLVRERQRPRDAVLVGFSGHRGSVIAGRGWGEPMERMEVPRAMEGSWEDVLHGAGGVRGGRLVLMDEVRGRPEWEEQRGHRAIGVVYHSRYERGNYVPTVLPARYDALIALEETRAVSPLHTAAVGGEVAETFPSGV